MKVYDLIRLFLEENDIFFQASQVGDRIWFDMRHKTIFVNKEEVCGFDYKFGVTSDGEIKGPDSVDTTIFEIHKPDFLEDIKEFLNEE